jgi:hypothetical protein
LSNVARRFFFTRVLTLASCKSFAHVALPFSHRQSLFFDKLCSRMHCYFTTTKPPHRKSFCSHEDDAGSRVMMSRVGLVSPATKFELVTVAQIWWGWLLPGCFQGVHAACNFPTCASNSSMTRQTIGMQLVYKRVEDQVPWDMADDRGRRFANCTTGVWAPSALTSGRTCGSRAG